MEPARNDGENHGMQASGRSITNYGVVIAYCQGVLERALEPFPLALAAYRAELRWHRRFPEVDSLSHFIEHSEALAVLIVGGLTRREIVEWLKERKPSRPAGTVRVGRLRTQTACGRCGASARADRDLKLLRAAVHVLRTAQREPHTDAVSHEE